MDTAITATQNNCTHKALKPMAMKTERKKTNVMFESLTQDGRRCSCVRVHCAPSVCEL